MSQTICYVCYEVHVLAFLSSEQTVNGFYDSLDDINVLPLVETADIVSFCNLSIMEYGIDGACMVFNIQPVTYILTLTIYRKRLAIANVIDE